MNLTEARILRWPVAIALLLAAARPAVGQAHAGHSPYTGMENRPIKALAPEEVEGLEAGEGMGFALAAELNGYPGPKHVLDLADDLGLSSAQRDRVEAVRGRMSDRAKALGARVVEAEARLDTLFSAGLATPEAVASATREIGRMRGELRAVHLVAHLETRRLLTRDQVQAYRRYRGYGIR